MNHLTSSQINANVPLLREHKVSALQAVTADWLAKLDECAGKMRELQPDLLERGQYQAGAIKGVRPGSREYIAVALLCKGITDNNLYPVGLPLCRCTD